MKRLGFSQQVLAFVAILGLTACGPVPGGTLGGVVRSIPSDWTTVFGAERTLCEIESRPANPHSIQLDCFLYEGEPHVQSHRWALSSWWPVESWAAIWIVHPDVRLRIDQQIFEVRAIHVSDPIARSKVLQFRGYDPVPEGIEVFRFAPREDE